MQSLRTSSAGGGGGGGGGEAVPVSTKFTENQTLRTFVNPLARIYQEKMSLEKQ